jgi:DNA-binding transcriptional MocR family regulator
MAPISFARGAPAPECLPVQELADCARAAIAAGGAAVLGYGPGAGYGPLREWIAERHDVDPARVVLTNGSLQGFAFLLEHLARSTAGRLRVLVEAPTYDRPLKLLAEQDADVVALTVDDDGLDPAAVEAALDAGAPPALLYTIPTFQNPSGQTLGLARRRRLAELARERGLLVLEDDPYGLVRFEGEPLPSLFELEGGERVVYASSFSKTVAPGLRVGWMILPPALARAVESVAVSRTISPVLPAQATAYEFVRRGRFEPNLERVRSLLRARRDAMLESLEAQLPAEARWSRPEGGYFVWLELPARCEARDVLARAAESQVTFVPGSDFYAGPEGGGAARLAFSFATPDEIREGVRRLAALLPAPAQV